MFAVRNVGVRVGYWGVVLALCTGLAGCATGCASGPSGGQNSLAGGQSGGGSGGGGNGGGGETAPQAWSRLQGQKNFADTVNIFLKNPSAELFDNEVTKANAEVDQAMRSPLPIEALDAMVDDVAQRMVKDIPQVPEVKNSKNQLILAFSTISDATASNNPNLAEALESLRAKLSKSENMTNNFVFVTTTESDANSLSQKIAGNDTSAFRDPLQRTADTSHPVVYDPAAIFLITGSLHNDSDHVHHTVRIKLSLQFNHVQTRRMVENDEFIRTYMWHPTKHNWELQP